MQLERCLPANWAAQNSCCPKELVVHPSDDLRMARAEVLQMQGQDSSHLCENASADWPCPSTAAPDCRLPSHLASRQAADGLQRCSPAPLQSHSGGRLEWHWRRALSPWRPAEGPSAIRQTQEAWHHRNVASTAATYCHRTHDNAIRRTVSLAPVACQDGRYKFACALCVGRKQARRCRLTIKW